MKRSYALRSLFVLVVMFGSIMNKANAQNYVTVGAGATNSGTQYWAGTSYTLFSTYYHDARHQIIYTAADLTAAGLVPGPISSIGFHIAGLPTSWSGAGPLALDNFKMGLKNTSSSFFPNSTFESGITPVYSSPAPVQPALGWLDFSVGIFIWDGTSNLIVETCFDNSSLAANWSMTGDFMTSSVHANEYTNGAIGCLPSTNNTSNSFRPQIRFTQPAPLQNDAGLLSVDTPMAPSCVLDSNLYVTLFNQGVNDLTSATISWTVNGVAGVPYTFTGNLPQYADTSIHIGTYNFQDHDQILAWVSSTNGVVDSNTMNDSTSYLAVAALNGLFTIGPDATDDYNSFTSAIDDLYAYGVCGPVTFNVKDSMYVEQLIFSSNPMGMNASNTITFQSIGGADSCVITWGASGSSDNFIVMAGSDNLTFDGFTFLATSTSYGRSIVAEASISNFTLKNSFVLGQNPTTTSHMMANVYFNGGAFTNITLTNNKIVGGSYGFYLRGSTSSGTASNLVLENNQILNPYYASASVSYWDGISVSNNEMIKDGGSVYNWGGYGVVGSTLYGDVTFANNLIVSDSMGFPRTGIDLYDVNGNFGNSARFINNRMWLGEGGSFSNTYNGIIISSPLFVEVSNNSIIIDSASSSSSRGIYLTNGAANFMHNNAVTNYGDGYAVYLSGSSVLAESDNNSLYSNGSVGYMGGVHATLVDWQAATGMDSNSISVRDFWTGRMRIATCSDSLNGMGMPLANNLYDYEGQMRDANTPDIGADEFTSVAAFSLGNDNVLCAGLTLDIEAAFWDTVTWSTGYVGNTLTVSNPGIYSAVAVGACGTAYDTVDVQAQTMPSLPATQNICDAATATLDPAVGAGATYMWNDGSSDSTLTVGMAGTYSVAIVDAFGCNSVDTVEITQSPVVSLNDEYRFCEGDQADLDAAIPGSYVWNDGSQNQFLTVTAPGTYWVEVTDGFGCVSADTTEVVEVALPVAMYGTDNSGISFYTVVFSDSSINADSWLWDFGDGSTSTQQNPTHVYQNTWVVDTYTVVLTVSNECGTDVYESDIILDMVGVEELANGSNVNVYPNPSRGLLNVAIESATAQESSIEILDIQGRQIQKSSLGVVSGVVMNELDLTSMSKGIYLVRVTVGNEVSTQRVTLQ